MCSDSRLWGTCSGTVDATRIDIKRLQWDKERYGHSGIARETAPAAAEQAVCLGRVRDPGPEKAENKAR